MFILQQLTISQQVSFQKSFKDYKTSDSSSNAIEQTKPISILLMGVDTGDSERTSTWEGNSDSMILVTVNPETKKSQR